MFLYSLKILMAYFKAKSRHGVPIGFYQWSIFKRVLISLRGRCMMPDGCSSFLFYEQLSSLQAILVGHYRALTSKSQLVATSKNLTSSPAVKMALLRPVMAGDWFTYRSMTNHIADRGDCGTWSDDAYTLYTLIMPFRFFSELYYWHFFNKFGKRNRSKSWLTSVGE